MNNKYTKMSRVLPKAQTGIDDWVQRAANANLNFWEMCRLASSADNGKGGFVQQGDAPKQKVYASPYEELADIKGGFFDKEQMKNIKRTLPQGVSMDDWVAFNREAGRMNVKLSNPDYAKYTDSTGMLKPEWQSVATNFDPYYLYYRPAFANKTSITADDIMKFYQSQPGGISNFKLLVNNGYRMPKRQMGGPIVDARGQWAHPGKITRIPSSNITMQGVPYPVLGVGNNGQKQMMYPGMDYSFNGASYVDEYPMMQKGGRAPIYTSDKNDPRIKAYKDSLELYNQTLYNLRNFKKKFPKDYIPPVEKYSQDWKKDAKNNFELYKPYLITKDEEGNGPLGTEDGSVGVDGYKNKLNPKILPIGKYFPQWSDNGYSTIQVYKKPIPVIYQDRPPIKSVNIIKSIPLINNIPNITAGVPVGKSLEQQPTNYSVTFRDENSPSKQRTVYFPDLLAWKNFTDSNGYMHREQTGDGKSAQAIGYNQYELGGGLLSRSVTCSSCGHSWKATDGGADALMCHKCGGMVKMKNGGQTKNERDMVNGIADILSQVKDSNNRAQIAQEMIKDFKNQDVTYDYNKFMELSNLKNGGEMIRRADGSYSRRGFWDNIRENKGSGKKPTKEMLEQERKIRRSMQVGGSILDPSKLPYSEQVKYVDSTLHANMNKDFVRRLYDNRQSIPQPFGTPDWNPFSRSSHLMSYDPGSRRVYPSVVSINGKLQHLPFPDEAWNYADDNKEYIEFPTAEAAAWFANSTSNKSGYKMGTNVLRNIDPVTGLPKKQDGGGIPERYKNMGFTHVGQKKEGDGQHKWKVLAKKGDSYKVVQGGYRGMKDFSQHHDEDRKERFWDRMGGRNSAQAQDPFSPLYWHKRFGTWKYGGSLPTYQSRGQVTLGPNGQINLAPMPYYEMYMGRPIPSYNDIIKRARAEEQRLLEEKQQRINERKAAVAAIDNKKSFKLPTGETKTYDKMTSREKRYVEGKALEQRGRFFENEEKFFDEYLNPLNLLGTMAGGLGKAPLEAKVSNSNLPYFISSAIPLGVGALGSLGAKNTGQFINNIFNPAAGLVKPKSINPNQFDLEKLRSVYHNNKRFLTLDEANYLNRQGVGNSNNYILPSNNTNNWETGVGIGRVNASHVPDQLPPPPPEIDILGFNNTTSVVPSNTPAVSANTFDWNNYFQQHPHFQSTTPSVILENKSMFTREDLLNDARFNDHDLLSKMSDDDFKNTVLTPAGKLIPYKKALEIKEIIPHSKSSSRTILNNAEPLTEDEYVNIFNQNLDLLNSIIKKNNKSGLEYSVKGLTPGGHLTFSNPKQFFKGNPNLDSFEYRERLKRTNENLLNEIERLRTTVDPTVPDPESVINFNNRQIADNQSLIDHLNQTNNNFTENIVELPEGQKTWSLILSPGKWKGEVENIANTDYFKSIPGISMYNTSGGVFSDGIARRGTGTYDSINEYLKQLNLGRVKSGFNSQTDFSKGLWENVIKKEKGYGFYNRPDVVHGIMKRMGGNIPKYQSRGEVLPNTLLKKKIVGSYTTPLADLNLREIKNKSTEGWLYKPNCPDGVGCAEQAVDFAAQKLGLQRISFIPGNAAYRTAQMRNEGMIPIWDPYNGRNVDKNYVPFPSEKYKDLKIGDQVGLTTGGTDYFRYGPPAYLTKKDNNHVEHWGTVSGFTPDGIPYIHHGYGNKTTPNRGRWYDEPLDKKGYTRSLGHGTYRIGVVYRTPLVTDSGVQSVDRIVESADELAQRKANTTGNAKFYLKVTPEDDLLNSDYPVAAQFANAKTRLQTKKDLVGLFQDKELDYELKYKLGLTQQEIDRMKPVVYGMAGQETNFNDPNFYRGLKEAVAQFTRNPSLGMFQIKMNSLTDDEKRLLDINKRNDLKDTRKAYMAAMAILKNSKNVMDRKVEKGVHPGLQDPNIDPYFSALYYYNTPMRAVNSAAEMGSKESKMKLNPVTWFNWLPGKQVTNNDLFYDKDKNELRMDPGSYPYKVLQKAKKDLGLEYNNSGFDTAPELEAAIVYGSRNPKTKVVINEKKMGGQYFFKYNRYKK